MPHKKNGHREEKVHIRHAARIASSAMMPQEEGGPLPLDKPLTTPSESGLRRQASKSPTGFAWAVSLLAGLLLSRLFLRKILQKQP